MMKEYFSYRTSWLGWAGLLLLVFSCQREPGPDPENIISKDTLMLNQWIWEGMNDYYLWEAHMPTVNITRELDPRGLFQKLLYAGDRDSWITDDYETLIASFSGVDLATGMEVYPGKIGETEVVAPVGYVTPHSPAADSGITRGDIVMTIDGQSLNVDNFYDLYYQTTATFGFGTWDGSSMQSNGISITLTAVELNQNPITHTEIIEYQGYKIGYLVYAQFVKGPSNEWFEALKNVFLDFKTEGVTDVVIDLRYNRGGILDLAAYMASSLAPVSAMNNHDVFANFIWNEGLNQYFREADLDKDGKPDGEDSEQLVVRFPDSDANLNLNKVYFLTSPYTASASESLMVGLYPYCDVIQIGGTTYGKCYGSITIDDWNKPKRHNWAMQPLVLKYANAEGYTDFIDGIPPDYFREESLLNAAPFGSVHDPLLEKALEDISGVLPKRKKAAEQLPEFTEIPMPRKRVVERVIDWPDKPGKREVN